MCERERERWGGGREGGREGVENASTVWRYLYWYTVCKRETIDRVSNVIMQSIYIYSNAMFLETVNPYAKNATVKTTAATLFFLIDEISVYHCVLKYGT